MTETRVYKDRAKYMIAAVTKRRKRLKEMAIERKGGKCELCGYHNDFAALEFHHKDSSKKDFGLSTRGLTRSWSKITAEVDKCMLLCANCHREVHSGRSQLPGESSE